MDKSQDSGAEEVLKRSWKRSRTGGSGDPDPDWVDARIPKDILQDTWCILESRWSKVSISIPLYIYENLSTFDHNFITIYVGLRKAAQTLVNNHLFQK